MKRILGIILILIVLAAFTPLWGSASEAATDLTCSYLNTNGGELAAGEYKLIEDECIYKGEITLNGDVSLDLNGKQLNSQGSIRCSSHSCSLTITDKSAGNTGTLTVETIFINGSLEISGGTVTASGGTYGIYADGINIENGGTVDASGAYYGIYAGSHIDINESGTVTATGGTYGIYAHGINISGTVTEASGDDYGIYASGGINISGTVTEASGGQYGIYAGGINISGTVTEASGGQYGIYAGDIITISGTVTEASGDDYGIYASGGINISGTVTEASGGQYGIYADNDIYIFEGDTVTATGTNVTGIYADNDIYIFEGGTVTATGGKYGIYAGSHIDINESGTVTATGGTYGIHSGPGGIFISGENTQVKADNGISTDNGTINICGGTVTTIEAISANNHGYINISGGQVSAGMIQTGGQNIKLGWDKPTDFIHAQSYIALSGTIEALKPFSAFATEEVTGDPKATIKAGTVEDTNTINGKWLRPPQFTITWNDHDGSVLKTTTVTEGDIPAYVGESPTRARTAQYSYTFAGWTPEIVPAVEDTTYTAVYTETVNQYSVTFVNEDGTVLKAAALYDYGTKATAITTPADPVKEAADGIVYTFAGWEPDITDVTADAVYTAVFQEIETPGPEPERPGIDFFRLHGDCELPATGFSSLRPAVLPKQPKDLRYEPVQMHLMLPTLDREIGLVTMPREGNSWAAAWLGADAGILEGSALPGEGLSVIAGHNTLNDTDYGPFALLSTLEVNDTVMVREESGALKLFRVYANELLEPDDMERLSALAGDDALVLLTCENESAAGGYLNRRAVFAR